MAANDTYEANATFIRESLQKLEAGEVGIDDLEPLMASLSSAFEVCEKKLERTRQFVEKMAIAKQDKP